VPYSATATGTGGQDGLVLVHSSTLSAAPTISYPTSEIIGLSYNGTLNGNGRISAISPAYVMYAAPDSSNNVHIYGMDLTTSSTPVPHQIGSLSIALPSGDTVDQVICPEDDYAETNALQANTLFVVVHLPGAGGCNTSGDTFEVVNYTDGTSTAPHAVSIPAYGATALYNSNGTLASMLLYDSVAGVVDLYPYSSGTTPMSGTAVQLITGVESESEFDSNEIAGAPAYLDVTLTANSGVHQLYRLGLGSTTATVVYTAAGTLSDAADDNTNLYFIDNAASGASVTQNIYQLPYSGTSSSAVFKLFNANTYTTTTGQQLTTIGSNGSVLMLGGFSSSAGLTTENFYGIAVGQLTSALASNPLYVAGLTAQAQMVSATPGDISTSVVLINWTPTSGAVEVPTTAVLSVATTPAVLLTNLSNSRFVFGSEGLGGNVIRIQDISTTSAGNFYDMVLSSRTTTLMTNSGAAYGVANATVYFGRVSNQIGVGAYYGVGTGAGQGLMFDVTKNYMDPIILSNTSLTPF